MKTAIEWLFENVHIIPKFKLSVQDTIDKAKQMEKEQIINAWIVADNELQRTAAEGYYNEKYQPK